MEFDEYDYLEKTVEGPAAAAAGSEQDRRSSRRDGGGEKRSRSEERDGEKADRDRQHRHRSGRDSEREQSRDLDRDRDRKSRDRDHREGRERERERERSRRSSSRPEHRDDRERDRERERSRRSSSRPDHREEREREREKERERERSRRSSSRHEREAEIEREEAKRRERRARERELEREIIERESRRFKEKRESAEPEADPERDQRTVFAYQMPLKANERDVYEFFSQAGKVRDVRLIMDRNSRRSKGVGYIEFYDVMSVPEAIAMSGNLLLGQPVMVKPSEAEKNLVQSTSTGVSSATGVANDRKLYVGNLHYNMTELHLRQIFEAFGPVETVQLPLDPETGHCKGYGFVQFVELEHAKSARSLNGTLNIVGRTIKVSSVTDHYAAQNAGTNATDFDDEDGGGLSLNARSRAILMQKLDRTGTASSIAESLGIAGFNGNVISQQPSCVPLNGNGLAAVPSSLYGHHPSMIEPTGEPSECLLLKNMFDPTTETDPDFDLDLKEDIEEECSKFGPLKHIFVNKNSNGDVYLRFDSVSAAVGCQRAMDKRWYAGRAISATFMRHDEYEARSRKV